MNGLLGMLIGASYSFTRRDDGWPIYPVSHTIPTPAPVPRKCLLPSCQVKHTHNNAYCCADHCREHRAILRTSNTSGEGTRRTNS